MCGLFASSVYQIYDEYDEPTITKLSLQAECIMDVTCDAGVQIITNAIEKQKAVLRDQSILHS